VSDWATKLAGKFVVIDGPDGSGKSTQLKLLAEHLRSAGLEVVEARDPGGTPLGEAIRRILLAGDHSEMTPACETMLYMASRAELAAKVIRPAVEAGKCVLCDRYISATIAYQGAGGIDPEKIRAIGDVAVGGLRPDLTVILDIPAEVGLARLTDAPDRMESKDVEFHKKVRRIFLDQARQEPDRYRVVDAAGEVSAVQQRLREALSGFASAQ